MALVKIPKRLPVLLVEDDVLLPGSSLRTPISGPLSMNMVKSRLLSRNTLASSIVGVVTIEDVKTFQQSLNKSGSKIIGTAAFVLQVVGSAWPKSNLYTLYMSGLCRFMLDKLVMEEPYPMGVVTQLDYISSENDAEITTECLETTQKIRNLTLKALNKVDSSIPGVDELKESDFQEDDDLTQVNESQSIIPQGQQSIILMLLQHIQLPSPLQESFASLFQKDNKKRRQEQADEAFKTMKEIKENSSKRDEFSVFGELVANKLRKFSSSPRSVAIALHRINDILFNLQMEQYTMDRINTGIQPNTVNTFGGQLDNNPSHQYNSLNTSTSSSPLHANDNVLNLHQEGSGFSPMSSRSCSPLISMTNLGKLSTTFYPAYEKPPFLTNQGEAETKPAFTM